MRPAYLTYELQGRGCDFIRRGLLVGAAKNFYAAAHVDESHYATVSAFQKGLVLTHGAGGNSGAPLLVTVANAFSAAGWQVLPVDMAFRKRKPFGPPSPATSAADRTSLKEAVSAMRKRVEGPVVLGGLSYGGRQSSILASETPGLVEALLLLSYPLHPPGKPNQPRTAHFPNLVTPAIFVHGTKDPFGTTEEFQEALKMIPSKVELIDIADAGHDLNGARFQQAEQVIAALGALITAQPEHHA